MKKLFFLSLLMLASCAGKTETTPSEKQVDNGASVEQNESGNRPEEGMSELQTDESKVFPENVVFECVSRGEDEFGVPHNDVYLRFGKQRKKVGACLACDLFQKQDYGSYDIPAGALSACGGWFAGGGDYFYAIQGDNMTLEVYSGWQDEGQMEENDTSFHWKRTETFEL